MQTHRSRVALVPAAVALLTWIVACDGDGDLPPLNEQLPSLPPPVRDELPSAGPARPASDLVVAMVGEVRGEIDPCGCPTLPMGGFERRRGLLDELRAEGLPVFHLDAGNMLVEGYATGGRGDTLDRAQLMIDLSGQLGLDALCPGPADLLAMEPEQLESRLNDEGVALVSATWMRPDGQPWFQPSVVLERDGVRLGIIGLSARPGDQAWRARIHYRDEVVAARAVLDTLPDDLDLVVALSNLSDDQANRVARQVPGLAAVLAVANDAKDAPRHKGDGLVVEAPSRGRYVTALRVRSATDPGGTLDLESAERLDLETHDHIAAKQRRLEARGKVLEPRDQEALAHHRATLSEQGAGRNLVYVVDYPLGTRYRGDPETSRTIETFKERVLARAVEERAEEQRRPDGPRRYVSSSPCFKCHTEQYSRWALTEHTRAHEVLLPRGKGEDPECLGCHTTGFAVEGGWAETTDLNLRKFKAVQCEACHGPLEGHPDDASARPTIPTRETCIACHDQANSPEFDYATYLPRASCTMPPFVPEDEPIEADPLKLLGDDPTALPTEISP